MKKLIFILLCFCLMTFGSSAKIIEIAPAGAWGIIGISGGGAVVEAGAGPWTDDFNRDNETPLGGDWTTFAGDGINLVSNEASGTAAASYYTGSTGLAANQYVQVVADSLFYYESPSFFLRIDVLGNAGFYCRITGWTEVELFDASDDASLGTITTSDLSATSHTFKASIEGTGSSKIFRFYRDGVEQGTAISSISEGPDAAGYTGMYVSDTFDDFECGNL